MAKQRKAVIRKSDGYCENIIVVDGSFDPGVGKQLMDAEGMEIGGTWDGATFTPPVSPPPMPSEPSELEILRQALKVKGALTDQDLDRAKADLMK